MNARENHPTRFSRRQFLKLAALSLGSLAFRPLRSSTLPMQFPQAEALGRVNSGMVEVKSRPDLDSPTVAKLYEDAVVPWLQEVTGRRPYRINQRWVETPQGYIWAAELQPVKNKPNQPVTALKNTSQGTGMWAEVSVPYIDVTLDNPPARSPWLQNTPNPRLYYSQDFWIDQIKTDDQGQVWYRVNEKFGYGDMLWAKAEAFRPLSKEELLPIHPEIQEKRVVVDVSHQTLSCLEGKDEVYFARVSTGIMNDINGNPTDKWSTPPGIRPIWRKLISVHMTGGTTGGGYDLPGVSWTTLFEGQGVAIHSTFWHNNFGEPMSHGCVNAAPEDAKWVFRWTQPVVAYDPGDITVGMPGGTLIEVK
jgi:lipoprotein-anchoring transpeptidase ErfK/SrfK